MTTMIAWVGLNELRANAVYLASDSRISWGRGERWDAGRKLFSCSHSADIFGYCGDVLFPSLVLGQITELADRGLLLKPNMRSDRRHATVATALQASHSRRHGGPNTPFEILHVARQGDGPTAGFRAWIIRYAGPRGGWQDEKIELSPDNPLIFGSGGARLAGEIGKRLEQGAPDRNAVIFSTFCDGLERQRDNRSGGVPQLVGLFLDRPAQAFGIVHNETRFFHGLPVGAVAASHIPWRDRNFVAIDGDTMKPKRLVRRQDSARTRSRLRAELKRGIGVPPDPSDKPA